MGSCSSVWVLLLLLWCLHTSAFSSSDSLPSQSELIESCPHLEERASLGQRICANLIVKNEKPVIVRCLSTLTPLVNYWVVVDTGSTDGTQETIIDFMDSIGMPGQLHEREWVDFAHNRNQAIDLATAAACDYILVIDADEWVEYGPAFKLARPLEHDFYYVTISYSDLRYERIQLFSTRHPWRYVGVLHEALAIPQEATKFSKLLGAKMVVQQDGARSQDSQKALHDAQTLEKALLEDPTNSRYVFYLAQSYRDARLNHKAIEQYNKRIQMGGWEQEIYYSLYSLAKLLEEENFPHAIVVAAHRAAHEFRPSRLEPLYNLAEYYRSKDMFQLCYDTATVPIFATSDSLFVTSSVYEYDLIFTRSICAYWIGEFECSRRDSERVILNPLTRETVRVQAIKNLQFAIGKISEVGLQPSHTHATSDN